MAKILIIEDDPFSADILTRILKHAEHEVIYANGGITGLSIAAQERIDLVLLDMDLQDLGGHTVAALINRIPGKIPIVAISASDDDPTLLKAMAYGCKGYITKPIDTRTFIDQITPFIRTSVGEAGE